MRHMADVLGMQLDSVPSKPPNWEHVLRVFPKVEFMHGILFCYGDKIYNPDNVHIPLWLLGHECTHSLQQTSIGKENWWQSYLESPSFRLREELEAHRVELEVYNHQHNRALRRSYAHAIAKRLSGSLYGNMIKPRQALHMITEKDDETSEILENSGRVGSSPASGDTSGAPLRGASDASAF